MGEGGGSGAGPQAQVDQGTAWGVEYPGWLWMNTDLNQLAGRAQRVFTFVVDADSFRGMRNKGRMAIRIEGVVYPSLSAAATALSTTVRAVEFMAWEEIRG